MSATPAAVPGSAPIHGAGGGGKNRTRARLQRGPHTAPAPGVCHQLPAPGIDLGKCSPTESTSSSTPARARARNCASSTARPNTSTRLRITPPSVAVTTLVNRLKGVSSRALRQQHPDQVRKYLGASISGRRRILPPPAAAHHCRSSSNTPYNRTVQTRNGPLPRPHKRDRLPPGRERPSLRRRRAGDCRRPRARFLDSPSGRSAARIVVFVDKVGEGLKVLQRLAARYSPLPLFLDRRTKT